VARRWSRIIEDAEVGYGSPQLSLLLLYLYDPFHVGFENDGVIEGLYPNHNST